MLIYELDEAELQEHNFGRTFLLVVELFEVALCPSDSCFNGPSESATD